MRAGVSVGGFSRLWPQQLQERARGAGGGFFTHPSAERVLTIMKPDILLLSLAVFIWFPICFLPIVTHKLLARVRDDDGSDDGSGLLMIVSGRTKQQDDSDRRQSACAC